MKTIKMALALGLAGTAVTMSAPASAVITTFAQYTAASSASNMYWNRTSATGGSLYTIANQSSTTAGSVAVAFKFLSPSLTDPLEALASLGSLSAKYTFNAVAAPGNPVNPFLAAFGIDYQPLTSGSFSFIYTGNTDLVVNRVTYSHLTPINLLSATFTSGAISGNDGSTSGSIKDATTGFGAGTITYTSDLLSFSNTNSKDFAINTTSTTPALGFRANQALNSFRASTNGSFSTDPAPRVVAEVPEPAVWMMMIGGFGLVGLSSRRRGRVVAA